MIADLYHTLGVNRDAPMAAIRRAYRQAAKKAHPDAGGSAEAFALVKQASVILLDDAKHAIRHIDDQRPSRIEGRCARSRHVLISRSWLTESGLSIRVALA